MANLVEDTEEMVVDYKPDYLEKTLNWAASVDDDKPSPRLEFVKKFMALMTQSELGRLKKMVMNKRRNVAKDERKAKRARPAVSSVAASSSLDAVNSTEVAEVQPPVKQPWWKEFSATEILAFDTEMVTKPKHSPTKVYKQHVATVDVVDYNNQIVYSTKVRHLPGSFKDDYVWRTLTGLNCKSLEDPTFPLEKDVKADLEKLFKGKLIITIGGQGDYDALGLEMADFDYFDLQSHWFHEKVNEHGVLMSHEHSLRSLASFYLKTNPQEGIHTSRNDAIVTMNLFKTYQRIKIMDDPDNIDKRHNKTRPYNEIPALPNPIKEIVKQMKARKKIRM